MQKRRVLFHRSWTKFNGGTSGGQLKVRDAYEHCKTDPSFEPEVFFNKETIWYDNPGNLWLKYKQEAAAEWAIKPDDLLFFAGWDWKILTPEQRAKPPVPVINIAQPRQTRLEDGRRDYLRHPAIRISKSSIGKTILEEYGVNGPVFVIPDAIDFSLLPPPNPNPDLDILIVGLKNPGLATRLERRIKRRNLLAKDKWIVAKQVPPKLPTRQDFLNLVNRAKIVVCLPLEDKYGAEGFYLPALEAMGMGKFVICPYAVGNVDFCLPEINSFQPAYKAGAIYKDIKRAMALSDQERQPFIERAKEIIPNHSLAAERKSLLDLLHRADDLWADRSLFWPM